MENSQINFRIHGIEIISLSLNQRPDEGFEGTAYNFAYAVENKIEPDKNLIVSFVKVDITELDKSVILGNIIVACGIEVPNLINVLPRDAENLPTIPQELDLVIRAVAISTTRGIMFSEFKGTYLHNAIFPVVMQAIPFQSQQPAVATP